jgi:hypothetical protein
MFARLDAEERRLLSEYARAYPKIRSFYENVRMDVRVGRTNFPSEESLGALRSDLRSQGLHDNEVEDVIGRSIQMEQQYELRYRLRDGYVRIDTKVGQHVVATHDGRPSEPPKRVFVEEVGVTLCTPTMGYQLSKNDPSKQFFSLNAKRNPESFPVPVLYFDNAPFSSNGRSLGAFVFRCPPAIQGKPYVVEYVRQREIDGEQVVEIRVARTDYTDIFREITLYKDSWVVKEVYHRTGEILPNGEIRGIGWDRDVCTYNGVADGMPFLNTYQRSAGYYDKDTREEITTQQMFAEVTYLAHGPPDLPEFDVAQFLPPEVDFGTVAPAVTPEGGLSAVRIAAIVIGVILMILGIYMKIRGLKKS